MGWIYLDNNATTAIAPEARDALLAVMDAAWGNASSLHAMGGAARNALDHARDAMAELLGARPDEIVFTSGGTESDNTAIRGLLAAAPPKRRHVVTTAVEHPAVLALLGRLAREGLAVTELPVDAEGRLDLDRYRDALRDDTALVTMMAANNETGVLFPVAEAAALARERGIAFHSDAVQALGRVAVDTRTVAADALSFSGHKIHAAKGVGALFLRRKTRLEPSLFGGHQERDRRPGTENVPGIASLGAAATLARKSLAEGEPSRIAALRDRLEAGILAVVPGARVNGDTSNRLCNTTNLGFEGVNGQDLLLLLSEHELAASNGSACASGSLEPSHVLRAMRVPAGIARGSVRLSLSRYTTRDEIDRAIVIIAEAVGRLTRLR